MKNPKIIILVVAVILVIAGIVVYMQYDNWFSPESNDPSSNNQIEDSKSQSQDQISPEESLSEDGSELTGSCDEMDKFGMCTDLIGRFWRTPEIQKTTCSSPGVYNKGSVCSQPSLGGCQLNEGDDKEMIIWFYDSGENPQAKTLEQIEKTCNDLRGKIINNQ